MATTTAVRGMSPARLVRPSPLPRTLRLMCALRTSSFRTVRSPSPTTSTGADKYTNRDADAVTNPYRSIELDIDIGADARDWSSIQAQEKLKPVETELRRIEEMVAEVVNEMEYLRAREQKLRDTNESTNERVKWFAFGTMGMLMGLGAWQVVYLRAYFRFVLSFRLPWACQLCWGYRSLTVADPSTLSRLIDGVGYPGWMIICVDDNNCSFPALSCGRI